MDYNKEQKKIVEEVKKNCVSTKGGGKRDGDVCCGIIKSHIENYIPLTKKVIGPHIFIKDIPNELDLIVINKEAKPDDFVNSFNIDDVDLVLEIKKNGPRPAKKKPHPLGKTRIWFDKIKGKKSEVICCYLTISEQISKNPDSDYFVKSKNELYPYNCFMLCDTKINTNLNEGSWETFLKELKLIR